MPLPTNSTLDLDTKISVYWLIENHNLFEFSEEKRYGLIAHFNQIHAMCNVCWAVLVQKMCEIWTFTHYNLPFIHRMKKSEIAPFVLNFIHFPVVCRSCIAIYSWILSANFKNFVNMELLPTIIIGSICE